MGGLLWNIEFKIKKKSIYTLYGWITMEFRIHVVSYSLHCEILFFFNFKNLFIFYVGGLL